MNSIFFGIDPGKSGSISAIWSDAEPFISSFIFAKGTELDCVDWIESFDPQDNAVCAIEKVSSSPQMGVTSAFTFGRSYGFLVGVLTSLGIRFEEVRPQRWQKDMGCMTKGDKNVSKQAAQRRWPAMKITHANADSMLIAEWARLYGSLR